MKFWLYFLGYFFLSVTVYLIKYRELNWTGFGFSALGGLVVATVIMLNQAYKRSRELSENKDKSHAS